MNYIKEINTFYRWLETNPIDHTAILLWHTLMHVNNGTGWKQEFNVSISTIQAKMGCSASTVKRARKVLIDQGLIKCRSRDGQQSAVYTMVEVHLAVQIEPYFEPQNVKIRTPKPSIVVQIEPHLGPQTPKKPEIAVQIEPIFDPIPKQKPISTKQKPLVDTIVSTVIPPTDFWKKIVDTWFVFYTDKFGLEPTFNGPASKGLKQIVDRMKKMTLKAEMVWSEENAVRLLLKFLNNAYSEKWLQDNFMLPILYQKFDSIISKKENNGKQATGAGVSTKSAFDKIDQLTRKDRVG